MQTEKGWPIALVALFGAGLVTDTAAAPDRARVKIEHDRAAGQPAVRVRA
ncbi:hypothetical protein [Rhodococcus ruber]